MSYDGSMGSLGKRPYAAGGDNYSASKQNGAKGDGYMRPRDQKDTQSHFDMMESRETRDTTNDVSGAGGNVAVDGDFSKFPDIPEKSIQVLKSKGFSYLFPIQQHCFQPVFQRDDLIARDLTGSGKTFAFGIPIIEYLRKNKLLGTRNVQSIILAPTRELALQITKELEKLMWFQDEFRIITVYGGVPIFDQTQSLRRGVDIFVGTTGRVLDHIERGNINFSDLKTVVLDEADVMLKLGFKEDVEKILGVSRKQCGRDLQVLLFSATIPSWVKDIARHHMKQDFAVVDLARNLENKTARNIQHLAIQCYPEERLDALAKVLQVYGALGRIIVFTSTKSDANSLLLSNKITHDVEVMHGDIAQNQREVTLKRFKDNKFQVLVATDVASRGLDIPNVELIVQLEPPKDTECYIHRSGRTARAGKHGFCVTFYDRRNEEFLFKIEDLAKIRIKRIPIPSEEDMTKAKNKQILQKLKEVEPGVIDNFDETADILIREHGNDAKKALKVALAFATGQTKQKALTVSLLNGREGYSTIQMNRQKGETLDEDTAFGIIHRYWAPRVASSINHMHPLRDRSGVCFDLRAIEADGFMENFEHLRERGGRIDFQCERIKKLPDLDSDDRMGGGFSGGYHRGGPGGGNGGFSGNHSKRGGGYNGGGSSGNNYGGSKRKDDHDQGRGGNGEGFGRGFDYLGKEAPLYNQPNFGGHHSKPRRFKQSESYHNNEDDDYTMSGSSTNYSRGNQENQDQARPSDLDQNSMVYLANLHFKIDEQELMEFVHSCGLKPVRAKVLIDRDTGRSKGSAFVQMKNGKDAQEALDILHQKDFRGRELVIRMADNKVY